MMQSRITSKGQATIPKPARDHINAGPGDQIRFFCAPDGSLIVRAVTPASALRGIVPKPPRPVSIEDMNDTIAAAAAVPEPES